jgi:hypothetical protein
MASLSLQVIVGLMAASILCGALALPGLDNPKVSKRWYFRPCLFVSCFLLPFSVTAVAISLVLNGLSLQSQFVALPFLLRLLAYCVPTLLMWLVLYRTLLRSGFARGR